MTAVIKISQGIFIRLPKLVGLASVALLAASTQVWAFPYPRVIFMQSALLFAIGAFLLEGLSLCHRAVFDSASQRGSPPERAHMAAKPVELAFLLVALFILWAPVTRLIDLVDCTKNKYSDMCAKTIDQMTKDDKERLWERSWWTRIASWR